MEILVGQPYKIPCELPEDDTLAWSPKKYITAILLKEFDYFYLFQTKHYQTTVHKADFRLIKEDKIDKRQDKKTII